MQWEEVHKPRSCSALEDVNRGCNRLGFDFQRTFSHAVHHATVKESTRLTGHLDPSQYLLKAARRSDTCVHGLGYES